jgi:MFS family permease
VAEVAKVDLEGRPRGRQALWIYAKSFWPRNGLSAGFWIFFTAAFFFDFGIGLYFFLFNLFLASLHFNERIVGIISGALTMGNVAGTIPISMLARRFGLQKPLLLCFVAAPLISCLRIFILWPPAQIGLAFLTGVALCSWPVCFSPVVARLTTEENRVFAFSVVFATGIGSGTVAGLVGGYLPDLLKTMTGGAHLVDGMRLVLLLASAIVMLGIWPILKLQLGPADCTRGRPFRLFHPFLYRFLPPFALWSLAIGAFTPFAAIYLQQYLRIPLGHVGIIFSISQLGQFVAVLLAPLLFRRLGTIAGIVCTQIATGVAVFALGCTQSVTMAIVFYLGYTSFQFMSGPGIYSLLMSHLPDEERSTASAVQNIVGALSQAAAAVITGNMIVRYGYPKALTGNAGVAAMAALLFLILLRSIDKPATLAVAN